MDFPVGKIITILSPRRDFGFDDIRLRMDETDLVDEDLAAD
jgi:hypothetical protein